jgi:hypothetical protein
MVKRPCQAGGIDMWKAVSEITKTLSDHHPAYALAGLLIVIGLPAVATVLIRMIQ